MQLEGQPMPACLYSVFTLLPWVSLPYREAVFQDKNQCRMQSSNVTAENSRCPSTHLQWFLQWRKWINDSPDGQRNVAANMWERKSNAEKVTLCSRGVPWFSAAKPLARKLGMFSKCSCCTSESNCTARSLSPCVCCFIAFVLYF